MRHLAVIHGIAATLVTAVVASTLLLAAPARVVPLALPLAAQWTREVAGAPPLAADLSDSGFLVVGFADHLEVMALSNGATAWSSPIPAALLACESKICVAGDSTAIRAIDLAAKTVRWQKLTPKPLAIAPTLRSGWVFLTSADGHVTALRDTDGSEVWTFAAPAPLTGPPSVDGAHVALASADGHVTLVDLKSGKALWATRLSARPGVPKLGGGMVYVGTEDRRLAYLTAATGQIKDLARTGGAVMGAPALDDRFVYTGGHDGVLRAFDRGNGTLSWYADLPTRPTSAGPVVDKGLVAIALHTGGFQLYLSDGETKKAAAQLAAPTSADSTITLAVPAMITGAGTTLRLVTVTHAVGDFSKWSASVTGTAPRLSISGLPATIPGLSLKLTAPR